MTNQLELEKSILSPPGDTIQETLESIKMSQAELAERMGRPKEKINDIIKGREPISTSTSFQLERVLGIPASFWLNREKEYRRQLFEIEQKEILEKSSEWIKNFPILQMKKLGWLPEVKEKHKVVMELLNFFSIATPIEWSKIYLNKEVSVAFRTSLVQTQNPYAISAWLRAGERQSMNLDLPEFNKKLFKECLSKIRELAFKNPTTFSQDLQNICLSCGVAVVYTPNLPKAPISGATRWFNNRPLIQLSGRYKTDDHFWFTFFHEVGHIMEHGKKEIFLEDVEHSMIDKRKENEADEFASKWLIGEKQYQEILSNLPITEQKVIAFSNKFRIPAGVIIGRLQHYRIIAHSEGNNLKNKINLFS